MTDFDHLLGIREQHFNSSRVFEANSTSVAQELVEHSNWDAFLDTMPPLEEDRHSSYEDNTLDDQALDQYSYLDPSQQYVLPSNAPGFDSSAFQGYQYDQQASYPSFTGYASGAHYPTQNNPNSPA